MVSCSTIIYNFPGVGIFGNITSGIHISDLCMVVLLSLGHGTEDPLGRKSSNPIKNLESPLAIN